MGLLRFLPRQIGLISGLGRKSTEHKQQITQSVEIDNEIGREFVFRERSERNDASFRASAHGTGQMQGSYVLSTGRKYKLAERL